MCENPQWNPWEVTNLKSHWNSSWRPSLSIPHKMILALAALIHCMKSKKMKIPQELHLLYLCFSLLTSLHHYIFQQRDDVFYMVPLLMMLFIHLFRPKTWVFYLCTSFSMQHNTNAAVYWHLISRAAKREIN